MRRRGRGEEDDRKGNAIKRVLSQRKTAYNPACVSQDNTLIAFANRAIVSQLRLACSVAFHLFC